jgi:hypothetical protein
VKGKSMILRAEHDGMLNGQRCHEDDGAIEMVVPDIGEGDEETVKLGIDALIDAYDRIWCQEPDRIYHIVGTPPTKTLVWPGGLILYSPDELRDEVKRLRRELLDAQSYAMTLQELVPEKKLRKLWKQAIKAT